MAQLLKLREACDYLGISERSLREMKANGEIRYIQYSPNGRIRFEKADLDAWIAPKTVPTAAERAKALSLPGRTTLRRRRVV